MEEEKLREAEAAEAETVRKLAAAQQAANRASEIAEIFLERKTDFLHFFSHNHIKIIQEFIEESRF